MSTIIYDLEAPREVLQAVREEAISQGLEVSEQTPVGSSGSPLHSPISGAEIREALETAIIIFKSAAALASFLIAARRLLRSFGKKGVVRATDHATSKEEIISADSP